MAKKKGNYSVAASEDEQQMLCETLAMDVAEQKLRDGTATSQMICMFVKNAHDREMQQAEMEKLELEKQLLEAKTKQIDDSESSSALYEEAIRVFKEYSGSL